MTLLTQVKEEPGETSKGILYKEERDKVLQTRMVIRLQIYKRQTNSKSYTLPLLRM